MFTTISLITLCVFLVALVLFLSVLGTEAEEPDTIPLTAKEMEGRQVLQLSNDDTARIEYLNSKTTVSIDDYFQAVDEIPLAPYFQDLAYNLCKEYKVNFAFFLAMAESESTFDLNAVSKNGKCLGLMQINKCNWNKYGLDANNKEDNIEIGIRMLSALIEKYGSLDGVVMAYKGGEAAADKWIADGFRLGCCDTISDRTAYWQEVLDK